MSNDIREFLRGLSDSQLYDHLRAYGSTPGCADRAALAQAELDRRRNNR